MPKFEINQRVQLANPKSPQHGRLGIVVGFDSETESYTVELDGQIVEVDEQSLKDRTFDWEVL